MLKGGSDFGEGANWARLRKLDPASGLSASGVHGEFPALYDKPERGSPPHAWIGAADSFGLPVSVTHALSPGVARAMAANRSGLQTQTLRNLVLAWVLTSR
jgi:hypothetical protein